MSKFSFEEVQRLFAKGDLPSLYNLIADEYELRGKQEERQRITEQLNEEIIKVSNPMLVDREYLDGIEMALEIINKKDN